MARVERDDPERGVDVVIGDRRSSVLVAAGAGSDATAVSYIEAETTDGRVLWGVGMDANIVTASLKAVSCAANRALRTQR